MILRDRPKGTAYVFELGRVCFGCRKELPQGSLAKPLSGALWNCLDYFDKHEAAKAKRKEDRKAMKAQGLNPSNGMTNEEIQKQDFTSHEFDNEPPGLF